MADDALPKQAAFNLRQLHPCLASIDLSKADDVQNQFAFLIKAGQNYAEFQALDTEHDFGKKFPITPYIQNTFDATKSALSPPHNVAFTDFDDKGLSHRRKGAASTYTYYNQRQHRVIYDVNGPENPFKIPLIPNVSEPENIIIDMRPLRDAVVNFVANTTSSIVNFKATDSISQRIVLPSGTPRIIHATSESQVAPSTDAPSTVLEAQIINHNNINEDALRNAYFGDTNRELGDLYIMNDSGWITSKSPLHTLVTVEDKKDPHIPAMEGKHICSTMKDSIVLNLVISDNHVHYSVDGFPLEDHEVQVGVAAAAKATGVKATQAKATTTPTFTYHLYTYGMFIANDMQSFYKDMVESDVYRPPSDMEQLCLYISSQRLLKEHERTVLQLAIHESLCTAKYEWPNILDALNVNLRKQYKDIFSQVYPDKALENPWTGNDICFMAYSASSYFAISQISTEIPQCFRHVNNSKPTASAKTTAAAAQTAKGKKGLRDGHNKLENIGKLMPLFYKALTSVYANTQEDFMTKLEHTFMTVCANTFKAKGDRDQLLRLEELSLMRNALANLLADPSTHTNLIKTVVYRVSQVLIQLLKCEGITPSTVINKDWLISQSNRVISYNILGYFCREIMTNLGSARVPDITTTLDITPTDTITVLQVWLFKIPHVQLATVDRMLFEQNIIDNLMAAEIKEKKWSYNGMNPPSVSCAFRILTEKTQSNFVVTRPALGSSMTPRLETIIQSGRKRVTEALKAIQCGKYFEAIILLDDDSKSSQTKTKRKVASSKGGKRKALAPPPSTDADVTNRYLSLRNKFQQQLKGTTKDILEKVINGVDAYVSTDKTNKTQEEIIRNFLATVGVSIKQSSQEGIDSNTNRTTTRQLRPRSAKPTAAKQTSSKPTAAVADSENEKKEFAKKLCTAIDTLHFEITEKLLQRSLQKADKAQLIRHIDSFQSDFIHLNFRYMHKDDVARHHIIRFLKRLTMIRNLAHYLQVLVKKGQVTVNEFESIVPKDDRIPFAYFIKYMSMKGTDVAESDDMEDHFSVVKHPAYVKDLKLLRKHSDVLKYVSELSTDKPFNLLNSLNGDQISKDVQKYATSKLFQLQGAEECTNATLRPIRFRREGLKLCTQKIENIRNTSELTLRTIIDVMKAMQNIADYFDEYKELSTTVSVARSRATKTAYYESLETQRRIDRFMAMVHIQHWQSTFEEVQNALKGEGLGAHVEEDKEDDEIPLEDTERINEAAPSTSKPKRQTAKRSDASDASPAFGASSVAQPSGIELKLPDVDATTEKEMLGGATGNLPFKTILDRISGDGISKHKLIFSTINFLVNVINEDCGIREYTIKKIGEAASKDYIGNILSEGKSVLEQCTTKLKEYCSEKIVSPEALFDLMAYYTSLFTMNHNEVADEEKARVAASALARASASAPREAPASAPGEAPAPAPTTASAPGEAPAPAPTTASASGEAPEEAPAAPAPASAPGEAPAAAHPPVKVVTVTTSAEAMKVFTETEMPSMRKCFFGTFVENIELFTSTSMNEDQLYDDEDMQPDDEASDTVRNAAFSLQNVLSSSHYNSSVRYRGSVVTDIVQDARHEILSASLLRSLEHSQDWQSTSYLTMEDCALLLLLDRGRGDRDRGGRSELFTYQEHGEILKELYNRARCRAQMHLIHAMFNSRSSQTVPKLMSEIIAEVELKKKYFIQDDTSRPFEDTLDWEIASVSTAATDTFSQPLTFSLEEGGRALLPPVQKSTPFIVDYIAAIIIDIKKHVFKWDANAMISVVEILLQMVEKMSADMEQQRKDSTLDTTIAELKTIGANKSAELELAHKHDVALQQLKAPNYQDILNSQEFPELLQLTPERIEELLQLTPERIEELLQLTPERIEELLQLTPAEINEIQYSSKKKSIRQNTQIQSSKITQELLASIMGLQGKLNKDFEVLLKTKEKIIKIITPILKQCKILKDYRLRHLFKMPIPPSADTSAPPLTMITTTRLRHPPRFLPDDLVDQLLSLL
jgi:hypothetical protein